MKYELSEENFDFYAAQNYNNPCCLDVKEFYDDISKFKYLKKLFKKYSEKGILHERLILNHIITLHNVFFLEAATNMCFYKINEIHWPALKTFLLYLNYIHEDQYINIPSDLYVAIKLQQI